MPLWLSILILVAAFVLPIAMAIWLVLRARRVPDQTEGLISGPDLVAGSGASRLPGGGTTG
jgi:hypothetical protein